MREEIRRSGPISFREYMDIALYHPEFGYYRRARDPFGKAGDFFTASQLQPVFGTLIGARIRTLYREMNEPADFTVVELGAGRGEMAPAFSEWRYVPLEAGAGAMPERFRGVVFSNEFFDALPVSAGAIVEGKPLEMRVTWRDDRFVWIPGGELGEEAASYLRRYFPALEEGHTFEVNLDALRWLERISRSLESGYVFTIDYGYTRREAVRFRAGTLMSYRRHTAREDVLGEPGEKDITAHVSFTALEERGAELGLRTVVFESLAQTLLTAGEADQFAAALAAATPLEETRLRLQLKTLLFGMGETFRTLIQRTSK